MLRAVLGPLRSFLVVLEEGSLNAAAARLRVSQPTLTRQVQALEHEIGGPLLERSATGVKATAAGHALAAKMRGVLRDYDDALAATKCLANGHAEALRIGFLMSAAQRYLHPALAILRQSHPQVRIATLDLTPGEQIEALRKGTIDLALAGQEGRVLGREFYSEKIATLDTVAILPLDHPLAHRKRISLKDLRATPFISAPEEDVPGRDRWIRDACRKAGFSPRFSTTGQSVTDALYLVASEKAAIILPSYAAQLQGPPVATVPIKDPHLRWDFLVFWQRGKASTALRAMVEALKQVARLDSSPAKY